MRLHREILNQEQERILDQLEFISATSLYLGGGTALALQVGHRTSVDFDFYISKQFDVVKMKRMFMNGLPGARLLGESSDGTLRVAVENTEVSVFYYPYPLIDRLVNFPPVKLASLKDIAAAKVAAVVQRARQRDFVDIYYLAKELGFTEVVKSAYKKFPWYEENSGIVIKSLGYFEEADRDAEANRVKVFDKSITWQVVKSQITQELKKFPKTD